MRASSLFLVFGVVLLMAWTSEAQQAAAVPQTCCFSFIDFPIPDSKVVSAVRTRSNCPTAGIVVTTPKNQFCVNPDEAWIKKHL
ncbi:chemokine (C-C motif) ligand 33, duplicate 3 [Megalobrama amblycephala]|uniref:chemokine (C-C motif) ligand 33, duplicate 3 n=1 Tax=Megalobrama amblycephala TaxID=75352 RepID=UPI0020146E24|nr:chemokine (C-C motif) ligand 33, duplicate 3 [Megalobrama amblycephala]XP_048015028.1 chemokine (C-C motif) ligand 33, duplicate 3 [Megalobrama amblycephala]